MALKGCYACLKYTVVILNLLFWVSLTPTATVFESILPPPPSFFFLGVCHTGHQVEGGQLFLAFLLPLAFIRCHKACRVFSLGNLVTVPL
ncbi:hypothetical protein IscW_ISCW006565 [Ixodes scapularis]|uniref:Uncharacterized protein n=1 Tax=Ixodes scapularis TaxID=6945 RepID=B7PPR7_IXOSC|nr:hypothetical protein IscW_ISCW006565 [Ixodes scapularis]|eukprot:XP_002435759.1 hypothetical protein IscW_ISCW006565 [Ixodes scapularis]